MSDSLVLPLILVLTMSGYTILMWVVRMTNKRGDQILTGVVEGVPASQKTRSLILFTQYLPYSAFGAAFVAIIALGIREMAAGAEDARVRLIGYMCSVLFATSAIFIAILVPFLFFHIRSAVRESA